MAQPTQLETRLVSILDSRVRRRTLSKAGLALSIVTTGLLTLAIGATGVKGEEPQRTRIRQTDAVPSRVIPPRVLESPAPEYTDEAIFAKVEGTVILEGHVDGQGRLSGLRVVKGLGYGLDEKAIQAVQAWRFSPALDNGKPVAAITQIDVDFHSPHTKGMIACGSCHKSSAGNAGVPARIGAGMHPPVVVSRVEPDYTIEAREIRYQGKVVLEAIVHQDGSLVVSKVVQGLDHGLTEKAIEALQQWKFKPGMRNGKPVTVSLNIEVNFNLK
jgi:TonB family protein